MEEGCTCSGDVIRVVWSWNTPSATLDWHLTVSLGCILHSCCSYSLAWIPPAWRSTWLSHCSHRAAWTFSCVCRIGCVFGILYADTQLGTQIFKDGKSFFTVFCSVSLTKIKHDCTHRGSLESAQRSKVCVRGAMNQAQALKSKSNY